MYLSEMQNVFFQNTKCICPNCNKILILEYAHKKAIGQHLAMMIRLPEEDHSSFEVPPPARASYSGL